MERLGESAFPLGLPAADPVSVFLIQLAANVLATKLQVMALVRGSPPPIWGTQAEFTAPGFGLLWP